MSTEPHLIAVSGVDIYVVAAQEQVVDTLQKTGVDRSVYLVDTYDSASVN